MCVRISCVAASPVDFGDDPVANGRLGRSRGELVDDVRPLLPGALDEPVPAVGRPDRSAVGRLAATARIERRPIEDDRPGFQCDDRRLGAPRVRVRVAERVGHSTVRSAIMTVGWTVQMSLYVPASIAGTS